MLGYYSKLSSEVYNLDKYIGRSFGDVEFYQARLEGCKGPILEPGVGTGRISSPFLSTDWMWRDLTYQLKCWKYVRITVNREA